jgi:dolichol kinase
MLLLFPAHAELGLTVLAVLAFGDGSATLGGLLFDSRPLPWNRDKTWSGTLCFLLAAIPMASLIYWGESHNAEALEPGVSFATALFCGGSAAFVAAIAESLRSRINDNVRVGLAASVAVAATHALAVGLV